jgi:hypothetical protein
VFDVVGYTQIVVLGRGVLAAPGLARRQMRISKNKSRMSAASNNGMDDEGSGWCSANSRAGGHCDDVLDAISKKRRAMSVVEKTALGNQRERVNVIARVVFN